MAAASFHSREARLGNLEEKDQEEEEGMVLERPAPDDRDVLICDWVRNSKMKDTKASTQQKDLEERLSPYPALHISPGTCRATPTSLAETPLINILSSSSSSSSSTTARMIPLVALSFFHHLLPESGVHQLMAPVKSASVTRRIRTSTC